MQTTQRAGRYGWVMVVVTLTAGCAPSAETMRVVEEGRQWGAPRQSVDQMTGLTTWSVQSPTLKREGYGMIGALILVSCTTNEGTMSKDAKWLARAAAGHMAASVILPSMDWYDWGRIKQVEAGLWEHDVLIQWNDDPSTTRDLSLVGGYGTPVSVRGDEGTQFIIELGTHRKLRIRADEVYEIPLEGAGEQIEKLARVCLERQAS